MEPTPTGKCEKCGKDGFVHVAVAGEDAATSRSYCLEHVPQEFRERLPFGPNPTPEDEIDFLQRQIKKMEQQVTDPTQRAEFRSEVEQVIAEIRAGRKRLND